MPFLKYFHFIFISLDAEHKIAFHYNTIKLQFINIHPPFINHSVFRINKLG
jgi:hypothetical protein